MDENKISAATIAEHLNLANTSAVYKWRNGHKSILLNTAVQLADVFNCSLDYLARRSEDYGSGSYRDCPKFSLNNWLNSKGEPHIQSVIKIFGYFFILRL